MNDPSPLFRTSDVAKVYAFFVTALESSADEKMSVILFCAYEA